MRFALFACVMLSLGCAPPATLDDVLELQAQLRQAEATGTLRAPASSDAAALPDGVANYVAICDEYAANASRGDPMRAMVRLRAALALRNHDQTEPARERFEQLAL